MSYIHIIHHEEKQNFYKYKTWLHQCKVHEKYALSINDTTKSACMAKDLHFKRSINED